MPEEQLISRTYNHSGQEMPEILYDLMLNVEEAFRMAGAEPREDYTYKDLMDYALQLFDSNEYEELKKITSQSSETRF
ncbi:hypothetical protein [Fodinibius sp. SL11]|uniref:hypothetical protein n=1 Tax=Fodinibius sp. SL11 TaxID=3425690 RepID=UPI003F883065